MYNSVRVLESQHSSTGFNSFISSAHIHENAQINDIRLYFIQTDNLDAIRKSSAFQLTLLLNTLHWVQLSQRTSWRLSRSLEKTTLRVIVVQHLHHWTFQVQWRACRKYTFQTFAQHYLYLYLLYYLLVISYVNL